MNLLETEKDKFSEKWWDKLSHCFSESYMINLYKKIEEQNKTFYVLPSSDTLYKRFKLSDPEDIKVVFLTNKPIISYGQSEELKIIIHDIHKFNGYPRYIDDLALEGVMHLSVSLTEPYYPEWFYFYKEIIKVLNLNGG